MSYEFAKKEIGDYRITIYQDNDAECPCTEWDLVGVYFWDYSDFLLCKFVTHNSNYF